MTVTNRQVAQDLVALAVEEARRQGADQAEAFYDSGEGLEIEVRDGRVENLKVAEESGLGLRVIKGNRLGFAFTADLSVEAVREAAAAALANARVSGEDPYLVLPKPPEAYPEMELEDRRLQEVTREEKIRFTKEMERIGRSADARIRLTESAGYQESRYLVAIASSTGVMGSYRGAYCGASLALVAGDGDDQQVGFHLAYDRSFDRIEAETIGQEAAKKAVRLLGARRMATKRVPVVFEPYVLTGFLEVISSALTAEAVQKRRSLFVGKVGEKVAATGVTLVDDGLLDNGLMTAPFDGEGVPSQRTPLITDGVLRGIIHNSYTGAKDGVPSTGNARRGSYKTPPELGTTNFYLEPGRMSPEEIISQTVEGLYLTDVMGMHTANPVSGDFSVGAAGIWIKNGELTNPVRGMVIAGNILDLLEKIDLIGNDLTFYIGVGAPTVRVAGLTVSGQ